MLSVMGKALPREIKPEEVHECWRFGMGGGGETAGILG